MLAGSELDLLRTNAAFLRHHDDIHLLIFNGVAEFIHLHAFFEVHRNHKILALFYFPFKLLESRQKPERFRQCIRANDRDILPHRLEHLVARNRGADAIRIHIRMRDYQDALMLLDRVERCRCGLGRKCHVEW